MRNIGCTPGAADMSGTREKTSDADIEQWEFDSLSDTESDSVFSSSATSTDPENATQRESIGEQGFLAPRLPTDANASLIRLKSASLRSF